MNINCMCVCNMVNTLPDQVELARHSNTRFSIHPYYQSSLSALPLHIQYLLPFDLRMS